jgi:hypothetical protein
MSIDYPSAVSNIDGKYKLFSYNIVNLNLSHTGGIT